MSESDRAEFLQDNADLFKDDLSTEDINEGEQLLKAFESGNYEDIEKALSKNMKDRIEEQRRIIDQELLIEEARVGDARDEVYIAELKRHKKYLEDEANLFKASIEVRLEQQQKQLDEYKSYLEDEREALEDSLNKRKEAYEKYFDEINQEEENDEYDDKANLLVSNLSKLGSSTNASAVQQTKELENQLQELEEERLKELRERAQEAVLQTIDDDVKEISEKFDKLLESNQALLAAMQGELSDPNTYITNLLSNKIENGATAEELEQYIGTLQSTYGSVLGDNVD